MLSWRSKLSKLSTSSRLLAPRTVERSLSFMRISVEAMLGYTMPVHSFSPCQVNRSGMGFKNKNIAQGKQEQAARTHSPPCDLIPEDLPAEKRGTTAVGIHHQLLTAVPHANRSGASTGSQNAMAVGYKALLGR